MSKPQWIRASQEDYEKLAEQHSLAVKALAAAEAKLADERRHADALAGLFEPIASGRLVPWLPCKHAEDAMAMHAARRAAEKEAERD